MDDFATGYLAGQDGGNNNGGFFGNEGLCGQLSSSLSSSAGARTAMAGTAVTTA